MRIAILGVGLIGGSIGLAARERIEGAEVVGFGRSPERLRRAVALGAIDLPARSIEEALEVAEVCFCCAPVGALPQQVDAALAAAPPSCVVSDVGSVKLGLTEQVSDERFVGGHPIAGAETAGVEHARPDLFEGATWYFTPSASSSGILLERLHRLVASLGARPAAIDAQTHDWLLAGVSHLPHVLANSLTVLLAEQFRAEGGPLPRIGPSFRDMTRVAGANEAIWTDIFLANRTAVLGQVRELRRSLADLEGWLEAKDREAIAHWIALAREGKRALVGTGLEGETVHELRLTVPNRPGIVARVALALGTAGVNISDLALAPAADMRTGAMTVWVAGEDEAARARSLIEDLGFPVAGGGAQRDR